MSECQNAGRTLDTQHHRDIGLYSLLSLGLDARLRHSPRLDRDWSHTDPASAGLGLLGLNPPGPGPSVTLDTSTGQGR